MADRFGLSEAAAQQLDELRELLINDPLAPTAVRDPQRVLDDHLADSLVALELEALAGAQAVVDVGSGAGLPGLPLAIALPEARCVLVESAARKCAFISRVVSRCSLTNVEVVHSRIESWEAGRATFEVVLARAVAPLEVVLEYASPLLGIGGTLIAWRGQRDPDAERRAAEVGELLGLSPAEVRQVWPYAAARDRHLYLFSKVMDTPPEFPRRPGMASKRPLRPR